MKLNKVPIVTVLNTKSLQGEIQRTVMGVFLVLVISYSAALGYYFTAGLSIASNVGFTTIAELYQESASSNVEKPSFNTESLASSYEYENLPEHIKELFPLESIKPGIPEIKFNTSVTDEYSHLVFLLAEQLPDGKMVYLTKDLSDEGNQNNHDLSLDFLEHAIFWGGVSILLLVHLVARSMTSRINRHILAMQTWAENLEISEATKPLPDFKYDELNRVADRLATSVNRVGEFVDREQSFLRHASHELRTPIAIISGNISLLSKLEQSKECATFVDRIDRACHTMQLIVTTLLWLGRENHKAPKSELINLKVLLENTISDHRYLLEGKEIDVKTDLSECEVDLPAIPLSIVLANLVRNAFQHTQSGEIYFDITSNIIQIRNSIQTDKMGSIDFKDERGIGLALVQRIAKRLGWLLDLSVTNYHVVASLSFKEKNAAKS